MNRFVVDQVEALNELAFAMVAEMCNNNVQCIYNRLIKTDMEKRTLGFWIWDIENNTEMYSPRFRQTLGFKNEEDFPNVPESWMNAIDSKSKKIALDNFLKHVLSKGKSQYSQVVKYNKKGGNGTVDIVCHGKIVSWENDNPKIMIGVHLSTANFK